MCIYTPHPAYMYTYTLYTLYTTPHPEPHTLNPEPNSPHIHTHDAHTLANTSFLTPVAILNPTP